MLSIIDPLEKPPAGAHHFVRSAARRIVAAAAQTGSKVDRLDCCKRLLAGDSATLDLAGWGDQFSRLGRAERHYRVSALYMLLMSPRRRQQLAAYFTPPHLSNHIFDRLRIHGFTPDRDRILDPASGGAAFLVPAADLLHSRLKKQQRSAPEIIAAGRNLLHGVEIEPGLAQLSEILISDVFSEELATCGEVHLGAILRANALRLQKPTIGYDVVVSNPPYGRVFRASKRITERWAPVITDGHVNTYAIFICLALEQVKPGGLVAVLVPTSFISGPYFANLRDHILKESEVLELNVVDKRTEEFIDVVQDTCVLLIRRRGGTGPEVTPTSAPILSSGSSGAPGALDLPQSGDRPWALPSHDPADGGLFSSKLSDLAAYGYRAKAGYFVWNRSADRLADREFPLKGEIPLIWARNVRAGLPVTPAARPAKGKGENLVSFAAVPADSPAIIREESIVLQRTTNRSQSRRLVGGIVEQSLADEYGGYVTENHTVVITRTVERPAVSIELLLRLLNSKAVDDRYRRISGTVSVSTKILRMLPLPPPALLESLVASGLDIESAADEAYRSVTAPNSLE